MSNGKKPGMSSHPLKRLVTFFKNIHLCRFKEVRTQISKRLLFGTPGCELPGYRVTEKCSICGKTRYISLNLSMPNKYLYSDQHWEEIEPAPRPKYTFSLDHCPESDKHGCRWAMDSAQNKIYVTDLHNHGGTKHSYIVVYATENNGGLSLYPWYSEEWQRDMFFVWLAGELESRMDETRASWRSWDSNNPPTFSLGKNNYRRRPKKGYGIDVKDSTYTRERH